MTDRNLPDLVQSLAQRCDLTEKSRREIDKAILKWFSGAIVKPMTLSALKAIHSSGGYDAFAGLLLASTDAERIALLAKIDKFRPEMQMRSTPEAMAHLEGLARGDIEPAAAPRPAQGGDAKSKAPAKEKQPGKRGIIAGSRY